jgi:hypothetical protein
LVAAGITRVLYIEPYTKSLALELHADSLQTFLPDSDGLAATPAVRPEKMVVVPYTGVGPRMYEDHFLKSDELKDSDGNFRAPGSLSPIASVRLTELEHVEKVAAELVPAVT